MSKTLSSVSGAQTPLTSSNFRVLWKLSRSASVVSTNITQTASCFLFFYLTGGKAQREVNHEKEMLDALTWVSVAA